MSVNPLNQCGKCAVGQTAGKKDSGPRKWPAVNAVRITADGFFYSPLGRAKENT